MFNASSSLSSQSSVFRLNKPKSASPRFSSAKAYAPYSLSPSPSVANNTAEVEKIPRPLNSFMIFRLEKQREIVDKCPGANHRDISKIISKWWKELPKNDKDWYVAEAEKRKAEHKALYPDYKFCPQKRATKPRAYRKRARNEFVARDFENKQSLSALFKGGMLTSSSSSAASNSPTSVSSDDSSSSQSDSLARFVRNEKLSSSKDFQFVNVQPTSSVSTSSSNSSNASVSDDPNTTSLAIKPPTVPELKVPEVPSTSSIYYPTTTSYYTVPPGAYSVPSQSTAYIHSTNAATANRTEPWVNYNIYANYYNPSGETYPHTPYVVGSNAAAPTALHYLTPNYHYYPALPPPVQYNTSCLYPYDSHNSNRSGNTSSTSNDSTINSVTENSAIAPSLLTQPFPYHS
ncbi:hypothetical protein [Parasitella parasitica]|uniref:HMG box domain-containing protein n=1 Tax=Parasitella parasitica TaxID=35722 RepID=A0A0B7N4Z1_9FUNG|nr:hypothetical protein [Parasitella parasitica]